MLLKMNFSFQFVYCNQKFQNIIKYSVQYKAIIWIGACGLGGWVPLTLSCTQTYEILTLVYTFRRGHRGVAQHHNSEWKPNVIWIKPLLCILKFRANSRFKLSLILLYYIIYIIIYMKKLLDSDWLRAVQFKCNTSAKSVTPVQKV